MENYTSISPNSKNPEENVRYISEVDLLRAMREKYKQETEKLFDEEIIKKIQAEKVAALERTKKAKLLLTCNEKMLNHLDQQRQTTEKLLSDTVGTAKQLVKEIGQIKKDNFDLQLTKNNIQTLLEDLKKYKS